MRFFALLFAVVLAPAGSARADAVSPPPTTCVDGSTGVTCHGPPRCAPATCTTDGDCGAGHVCQPVPLCIETVSCGGIMITMDPNVTGTCFTGHCAIGGTCMTQFVCVPSSAPIDDPHPLDAPAAIDAPAADAPLETDAGPPHSSYGCCSTSGASGGAGFVALLVGVTMLLRPSRHRSC